MCLTRDDNASWPPPPGNASRRCLQACLERLLACPRRRIHLCLDMSHAGQEIGERSRFIIEAVVEGRWTVAVTVCGSTSVLTLQPGDLLVLGPAFRQDDALTDPDTRLLRVCLKFKDRYTRFTASRHRLPGDSQTETVGYNTAQSFSIAGRELLRVLGHLTEREKQGEILDAVCRAILALALIHLNEDDPRQIGKAESTWRDVASYVDEHLHQPIQRTEVAAAVGIHPHHITKLFQSFTGMSYIAYLTQRRMARATDLLCAGTMPIKAVAYHCGYQTPEYFIRVFTRYYGMPPGQFQREHARL
jgi:AraC-like DNA-binding protein